MALTEKEKAWRKYAKSQGLPLDYDQWCNDIDYQWYEQIYEAYAAGFRDALSKEIEIDSKPFPKDCPLKKEKRNVKTKNI